MLFQFSINHFLKWCYFNSKINGSFKWRNNKYVLCTT